MAVLRLLPPSGAPVEVNRDAALVGREPSCDVVLNDGSVSRKHARFEKRGEGWVVIDQGSANGTFLDSQRIAESALHAGQELRFGAVPFRIELTEDPPDLSETLSGADDEPAATVMQPAIAAPAARDLQPPPPAPVVAPPAPVIPPAPMPPPPVAAPMVMPRPPTAAMPPSPAPPLPPRVTAPPPPPAAARPPLRSAAPPPSMAGTHPAPPKKGRGPLFWILGGCCGCVMLVVLGIALLGGGLMYMTGDAVKVTRDQMKDIKSGDMRGAYDRLSSGYQSSTSPAEFEAFVARHPGLKSNSDSTFWSRSVQNDTATLTGVLTATGGAPEPVTYQLVKEGGRWRISAIQFALDSSGNGGGGVDFGRETPGAPGSGTGTPTAPGSGLALRTLNVDKQPADTGTKVSISLQASGYAVQRAGDSFMLHLVEDLETIGPDGQAINSLSKESMQVLNDPAESEQPGTRDFLTEITITDADAPVGTYIARITIHDKVSGQSKTQDVPFELP